MYHVCMDLKLCRHIIDGTTSNYYQIGSKKVKIRENMGDTHNVQIINGELPPCPDCNGLLSRDGAIRITCNCGSIFEAEY